MIKNLIERSQGLSRASRLAWLVPVVAFGVALWFLFPLADRGVSRGIIALELVGDASDASALIGDGNATLTAAEIDSVQSALLWDVLVILLYTLGLVISALLLVPAFRLQRLRDGAVRPVMLIAALPGVLDFLENVALWIALGRNGDGWFLLATVLATTKFVILIGVLLILGAALSSAVSTPTWLRKRLLAPPRRDYQGVAEGGQQAKLGIALSGGGVRAATYSLGTLQTLENHPQPIGWKQAQSVTAVSGGAYMAGAWQLGRDYGKAVAEGTAHDRSVDEAEKADRTDTATGGGGGTGNDPADDAAGESAFAPWQIVPNGGTGLEERHLLNNLGYLTSAYPRGLPTEPGAPPLLSTQGSEALAGRIRNRPAFWATILAGFLANALAIAVTLIMVVIPIGLLLRWLSMLPAAPCPGTPAQVAMCLVQAPRTWAAPVAWAALWLVGSLVWVLVGKLGTLGRRSVRAMQALKYTVLGSVFLIIVLTALLIVLPLLIAGLALLPGPAAWIAAIGAAAGTLAAIARMLRKVLVSLAPMLGGIAFCVLLIICTAALAKAVWFDVEPLTSLVCLLGLVVFVLVVRAAFSPELWSMFAFYRGRLRSAYALRRTQPFGDDPVRAVPFADDPDADADPLVVREPDLGSYPSELIICASAHATTKGIRTHYRIPALSFTFSSQHVTMYVPIDDQGLTERYRCSLEDMREAYPGAGIKRATRRLTTMFAVALSSAAVSPAMGRFRIGPTSALLAFANIRLGAWLPNPRYAQPSPDQPADRRRFPKVSLGYLFKEFLGIHDPTDAFVYVSDGGHWENSGVVELLRDSMPQEIVMVDADAGRAETILQLSQAIDLAKLECDVDVFVDLEPLRGYPTPEGGPVFAQQSVTVGAARQRRPGGNRWTLLWYCKPILTPSTPTPLLAHREIDHEFPATSTLDQFFDTSTYLAYRDLGRDNAAQIHQARNDLRRLIVPASAPATCTPVVDVDAFLTAVEQEANAPWAARTFAALLRCRPPQEQRELFDHVRQRLQESTAVKGSA